MNTQALVPEIPTDDTLPAIFAERLNWQALAESVIDPDTGQAYTGRALLDSDFGTSIMQQLFDEDTVLKKYLSAFDEWWNTKAVIPIYIPALNAKITVPVAPLIELGERVDAVRLNEHRLIKEARQMRLRIGSEMKQERDARAEVERLRREKVQREDAERAKAAKVEEARAEGGDSLASIVEQEPVIPTVVSITQAAAGLPATPKALSGRMVYVRTVTDWVKFLTWLVAHPPYISMLKVEVSFTKLKDQALEIPGVKMEKKFEGQNRGK